MESPPPLLAYTYPAFLIYITHLSPLTTELMGSTQTFYMSYIYSCKKTWCVHTKTYTQMFIAALVTIAKKWEPKCLSTDEWIHKYGTSDNIILKQLKSKKIYIYIYIVKMAIPPQLNLQIQCNAY